MSTSGAKAMQAEQTPVSRPPTYDHLKSKKKPVTRTVRLALDSEMADEFAEAQQALRYAEIDAERIPEDKDVQVKLREAKAKVELLEASVTDASIKFVFRNIGRKPYEDILLDCAPTDAQKERMLTRGQDPDQMEFDPDRFPPMLIAASMIEPEWSEEEVMDMYNDPNWSPAELGILFSTAQEAQYHSTVVSLGKG